MSDLLEVRRQKLQRLRELGIDPYPTRFERTHTSVEARQAFEQQEQAGNQGGLAVRVAGRLVSFREMGRSSFGHLQDGAGRIQIYFRLDRLGEASYRIVKELFDVGDHIGVEGPLFRTRTGEITVEARQVWMLAKSLYPLPEKWHGLRDVEQRYRQRYVDLIVNERAREIFVIRTRLVTAIRAFLDQRGFLEVETPVLQPLYGGAFARPFVTYYNALEQHFYLRISDELYLKRLVVGGFERVYEIGKDFRNEGLSYKHNPEFTMLEAYMAYADYRDMMELTEQLIAYAAERALGTCRISYQRHEIDLTPPWHRLPLVEAVREYAGIDVLVHDTLPALQEEVRRKALKVDPASAPTWAKLVDEIVSEYVEPRLIQPAFLIDYPVELSPLAKRSPTRPRFVERFEPFVGGMELGNAFTELNDPLDQRERFLEQARARAQGDEEAQVLDEDFIHALEIGMPPTGGVGIGIDRLTMLLTDTTSIREVILFPQLRSAQQNT
ncbi:MAG: lysine--tRNA ligase [Chloroflexota bacterium]